MKNLLYLDICKIMPGNHPPAKAGGLQFRINWGMPKGTRQFKADYIKADRIKQKIEKLPSSVKCVLCGYYFNNHTKNITA